MRNHLHNLRPFLLAWLFALLAAQPAFSLSIGDYRSTNAAPAVSPFNWNNLNSWQRWNGTSWVTPSIAEGWPGQNFPADSVTIQAGNTITLNTSFVLNKILKVNVRGILAVANADYDINIGSMEIFPANLADLSIIGGQLTWLGAQSSIRIPTNSNVFFPPTYQGVATQSGSCNNNNEINIGGAPFTGTAISYTACTGQGNVCLLFTEVNDAGGTFRVVPTIDVTTSLGIGNISCNQSFTAKIFILGVPAGGVIDLVLSGSGPSNVTLAPATFTAAADGGNLDEDGVANGIIEVSTTVTTTAPGTYSAVANATLRFVVATNDPCFGFSATTETVGQFIIRPAAVANVVSNVPTSVCLNEPASIDLSNQANLPVTVNYTLNGGSPTSVNLTALGNASITVPTSAIGNFTYTFTSSAFTDNTPACTVSLTDVYSIDVTDIAGAAQDGDTKVENVNTKNLLLGNCRAIANVNPGSAFAQNVTGKAFVSPGGAALQGAEGRPLVGRRVSITADAADAGKPSTVTLFALQSEFTNFNNQPNNTFNLPETPADPDDYKDNIRIYKYSDGEFDPMTGLPTVGVSFADIIIPSLVQYNFQRNWWEITFASTGFSLFVISNVQFTVLPLNLVQFDAQLTGKKLANLTWKTTEERDVRGFEVEVSRDGIKFDKVGFVPARNTQAGGDYSYQTTMPGKLAYFRLKMLDKNGQSTYSPIKVLKTDELLISSYPNPVDNQLTVDLSGYPAGNIRLLDLNGRSILQQRSIDGINRINTSNLTNGMYLLEVQVGLETERIKITKLRR